MWLDQQKTLDNLSCFNVYTTCANLIPFPTLNSDDRDSRAAVFNFLVRSKVIARNKSSSCTSRRITFDRIFY